MGYLKSVGTAIIYIGLFLAVITFIPGIPPQLEFQEYSIVLPREIDPKLGPKNRLRGAEKLYTGELKGAESFDSYNGKLYSGIYGGYVVRLEEDRVVPVVKFGKKCDGIWQEKKCGRILGLKFDKKGNLYVIDTYYGIYKVDITTLKYKKIVDISEPIDGKIPLLPNSIDIAENGDIYWSHSNLDFELHDGAYSMLANPSGRLIRYNAREGKNEVLIKNIGFANGVKLSDDESFVIVAETMASRIIKYNLKGPKAGQQEVFIEALPGAPDNLHSDGHGGFFVTMVLYADPQHPQLFQSIIPHPYIRKMLIRLLTVIEAPFKLLQEVYPNIYAEKIVHTIGSFEMSKTLIEPIKKSIVFRIDTSGNILEALYSDDETIYGISSAYIHNNYLWLGSPWNEHVSRVPLNIAFPDLADNRKQSSNTKDEKKVPKATLDTKSERIKRDTESVESKNTASPTSTATPTTSKPATVPTTKSTSTAPKPTAIPTTMPKSSSNSNKPSDTVSEGKSASGSSNAQIKKETVKIANDAKPTKPDAPKFEKNVKTEQKTSAKQKTQKSTESEKVKPVEANRPKNDDKK